jgi:hypothetical protein
MNSQPLSSASSRGLSQSRKGMSPDPNQKPRRKRSVARQKRRFEAIFTQLPIPPRWSSPLPEIALPAVLQPTPWYFSKALSTLLLLGAVMSVVLLHSQDDWFVYREDVRFHSLIRLRGDDLYQAVHLEGLNIFWVEPETVRQQLLTLPWVQDAQVDVGLPTSVAVNVVEMNPVAVWVTNEGNYWLAANGAALPIATIEESALPELALPQIIDILQEARMIGDGPLAIDPQVLTSALTLMEAMPELEGTVRYNHSIGLNFALLDPAVWVYWGDGFDLEAKLENLAVARDLIKSAEEPAKLLDVRFVDRPYIQ